MAWAFQDAKAKLSEVVKKARSEGPQEVTLRGERAVVVLSAEEYDRLTGGKPKRNFIEFLLEEPPWPDDFVELINQRSKDPGRDIEF